MISWRCRHLSLRPVWRKLICLRGEFCSTSRSSMDPELPNPSIPEALIADQVAAQAAEPHGHHAPLHTHCQNCGAELQGAFCHRCGQHDFDFHRSFGHVFLETLENFFHFDEKFLRTIVRLLFQPGELSADFNAGKRASQMPPFRLYLFVSVLFFFVTSIGSDHVAEKEGSRDPASVSEEASQARDETSSSNASTGKSSTLSEAPRADDSSAAPSARKSPVSKATKKDSNGLTIDLGNGTDSKVSQYLTERAREAQAHPQELKEAVIHAVPKLLLFCLPVFALFTRLLFRRTGTVYLQHLIVALHFHTFVYLWWLVASGWEKLFGLASAGLGTAVHWIMWLWLIAYPVLMLRRLFDQSWSRTVLKTSLLASLQLLALGSGFVLLAFIMFLMV